MTEVSPNETILSRQLKQLSDIGIKDVVITTGLFENVLIEYCKGLDLDLEYRFVKNPFYDTTNYIYSIYCAREYLDDDIILMHGDLVFENSVIDKVYESKVTCMVTSSTVELPQKDFKAVIKNDRIDKIGIDFFDNAMAAQPLYKISKDDWRVWLNKISEYCENDNVKCYAENAFNDVSDSCKIYPLDVENLLCNEIDTPLDLEAVTKKLHDVENRKVYMCFSTDMLHSGHISIIKKASRLGKLIIGVLSDETVASYKRFPLLPFEERKEIFKNINGVYRVVEQKKLSYKENITKYKPDIVVHGDDWKEGFQVVIRNEVLTLLNGYGGKLVEFSYSREPKYDEIEKRARINLSLPDIRRGRLKKLLSMKKTVSIIEAHSGITGLIAEKTIEYDNEGRAFQFDGMWISSLCDSTSKGKPDIELVDMTSRINTINDIMDVTTKPIILDGDTGGLAEHFVYNVRTLERMGVSAIIIEDKKGLKKNSLFGNDIVQTQDSIESFSAKIYAGKKAQRTKEFMIIARIESLILEKGMDDALNRAYSYVEAGADGIMIHSRKKSPDEIFEFVDKFRTTDKTTPIVVVPTSFNSVTETEFAEHGVNIVIYANQLTRSGFPAMQHAASTILKNHRAKEADELCMSIKEILTLIPDEI